MFVTVPRFNMCTLTETITRAGIVTEWIPRIRRLAWAPLVWVPLGWLPLIGAVGCGGHLYRQTEHELAMRADTALRAAKLRESLVGERATIDSLLDRELSVVRRQAIATRDADLRAIVGGATAATSWDVLSQRASKRLSDLFGDSSAASRLITSMSEMTQFQASLAQAADLYRLNKRPDDPPASCPIAKRPDSSAPEPVRTQFADYENNCKRYLDAQQQLGSFVVPTTQFGSTNELIRQTESFYASLQDSVGKIRTEYKAAKKEHTEAVKRNDQSKVQDAAERAKKLLEQLDKPIDVAKGVSSEFDGLRLAGAIAKVEEQRETIGEILGGLLDSNADDAATPGPEAQTAITLLRLLPDLEKKVSAVNYPGVSVLLLESERLRLQLDALTHRLTNAEARLALLKEQRAAMIQELTLLTQTRDAVQKLRTDCNLGTAALADEFKATTTRPSCRERLGRGLLLYANSWTLARVPQEEIYYRLIGLRHSAVLDASENSLAQWESLIGVPVSRIIAYHASGIRGPDVATLINALGLGAIAIAAAH